VIYKNIMFVYDEPALVMESGRSKYLVIGDLHIGMEIGFSKKGIHLFNATERMSDRIIKIMKEFSLNDIIILGDVKNSILYPETSEIRLLKEFFEQLKEFNIKIVSGNHDAHLDKIIEHEVEKELIIGNFGFMHGNRKPSEEMMTLDYIISAHDHIAVRISEPNGAFYDQKAWALYELNKEKAQSAYEKFNASIKLISMPAFNDLIIGTPVEKSPREKLNPLLSADIFDHRSLNVYNLAGQRMKM
jgi:uncharacterized protein